MTCIFKAPQARLIREGHGNLLQYPCLENPMDRGAWRGTVCEVAELDRTERLTHTHTHARLIPREFASYRLRAQF